MNGQQTPDRSLQEVILDINNYLRYFRFDAMSGRYTLTFLPFSKSYDEHPYWLMEKLEFIGEIINKAIYEKNNRKKK